MQLYLLREQGRRARTTLQLAFHVICLRYPPDWLYYYHRGRIICRSFYFLSAFDAGRSDTDYPVLALLRGRCLNNSLHVVDLFFSPPPVQQHHQETCTRCFHRKVTWLQNLLSYISCAQCISLRYLHYLERRFDTDTCIYVRSRTKHTHVEVRVVGQ